MKVFFSFIILTISFFTVTLAAPQKPKKSCTPGTKWTEECRTCVCTEDGKISCSKEACPPQLVPRSRRTVKTDCVEGEHWKEDCHSCHCANGKPACTRELCESEAPGRVVVLPPPQGEAITKRDAPCEEGAIWKEDCHTCHCTRGHKACTRELCFSESSFTVAVPEKSEEDAKRSKRDDEDDDKDSDEDEKCPPNKKEWMEDCNKCYCGDDGLKVCSRALCPDSGPVVAPMPIS